MLFGTIRKRVARYATLHNGHETAHISYLSAVSLEGHGVYATCAFVLLVVHCLLIWHRHKEHHDPKDSE